MSRSLKRYSAEVRQSAKVLRLEGCTIATIARKLKIARLTLRRFKLPKRGERHADKAKWEKAKALRLEGWTIARICRKLKICPATLRRQDLPKRGPHRPPQKREKKHRSAMALRAYGYSYREITEKIGVSESTLCNWGMPKKGKRREQEKAKEKARTVKEARLLRSEGLKLKEISDFLGINHKAVELMRLGPAYRSTDCAVCGVEFRVLTSNTALTCSPECSRVQKHRVTRQWAKETEKGRAERRRSSSRQQARLRALRPIRLCVICGGDIDKASGVPTCGGACREEHAELQRQKANRAALECYNENIEEMRAVGRARAREDYETDPEYYRWKRRHIKLKDPDKYRDWNWRYGVRKALGCEPTEEMWQLLEARRLLHRELGWTKLGKRWVAHDDNLYGPGGVMKRKGRRDQPPADRKGKGTPPPSTSRGGGRGGRRKK